LLSVKETDKFEIERLKFESKNYKKQRDSRVNIAFSDYEDLVQENKDLANQTATLQTEKDTWKNKFLIEQGNHSSTKTDLTS